MKKLILITFAIISFVSFKTLVFAEDRVMNSDKGKVLISQNEYKAIFNFDNGITKEIFDLFVMHKIGVDENGNGGQKVFRMYMKIGEVCEITNNLYFKGCKYDNSTDTFTINLHEFSSNNKIEYIIKFLDDKIETQIIQKIDDKIITIANNARDTSLGENSINEKEVLMITIDNQKYIPVRFFSEILYYDITFNANEKNATISAYSIMKKDKTNCSTVNKTDSYYLYNECENGKLYILPATKKVYVSPSNQIDNTIVSGLGYSNESEIMNKVADYLVPALESRGIVTFRNKPTMTLNEIVNESKSLNVDFHFEIHSNAGGGVGPEIHIHPNATSIAKEIAPKIHDSLVAIYPSGKGRGVWNSRNLMETNPNNVNNGALVEVAFHDNYNDAKWIIDNFQLIGETMADAIANYYGM
ncbi:MAG: N-acetylmuramoyl-L-alanine amidase [Bacilli bacterium]|nr:N-acetylmuramoyl-L-alanine amidase [Bacilli bacterium]